MMGTNAAAVHICDSCGRNVRHGIMDSSFESRSLDRLWTLRISTRFEVQVPDELAVRLQKTIDDFFAERPAFPSGPATEIRIMSEGETMPGGFVENTV